MRRTSVPGAPRARNVQPKRHDPYRQRRKPDAVLICNDCGLVHEAGRWQQTAAPTDNPKAAVCPACQRIRDRYPAGTVRLTGMPSADRNEILALIRNVAQHERQEHPLERLMEVDEGEDVLVVTTTGLHLARCIAGALRRRFHGAIAVQYPAGDNLLHVDCRRPQA